MIQEAVEQWTRSKIHELLVHLLLTNLKRSGSAPAKLL